MIERIYIPTIRRADIQYTYDDLPPELQKKVVMVVESGERELYKYPCEYLELPEDIVGAHTQLSQTRKFIHSHAGTIKYAMIDDDLILNKRNRKYFNHEPDMEKSKRKATPDEILRIFTQASEWLDEESIGIVGLSDGMLPPPKEEYSDTKGVFGYLFFDGNKIAPLVKDIDTSIRVAEDLMFLFECLSRGVNTRVSNEFIYSNKSTTSDLRGKRPIWEGIQDETTKDVFQLKEHYDALRYIQKRFPVGLTIFEEDGIMKNVKHWSKIYRSRITSSLENFI